jgi:putative addiction module component (TIGR02574 family)
MPVTMQNLGIDKLTAEERLALIGEIWDSLASEAEAAGLTEELRQEIDRLWEAFQANPGSAVFWGEVKAEILARLLR